MGLLKEDDVFQRGLIVLIAGICVGLLPSLASAEATLEVHLIEAKKGDAPRVDPALEGFKKTFSRFPGFNQFAQKKVEQKNLKLGEALTVQAPGEKTATVTYRGVSKGFVKLRFKLGDLEMNVRVHNGGVFFHGGYEHDGGRIVLAVRARSTVSGKAPPTK